MFEIDLSTKTALITGGTRGIGLATAKALSQAGARCVLTHRWGSADPEEIRRQFAELQAPQPMIEMADVSHPDDTMELMARIGESCDGVDIFISNVAFAARTPELASYRKRSLFTSLEYSAWPLVEYVEAIQEAFERYPQYVVAISSDGIDRYYPGYDFVAASKSVLEVLTRYLGVHLADHGCRVNGIRFGMVDTESFAAMFGDQIWDFLEQQGISRSHILSPQQCGRAVLALCSGLLDAMQSEVITVDQAMAFEDNMMRRYQDWKRSLADDGQKDES